MKSICLLLCFGCLYAQSGSPDRLTASFKDRLLADEFMRLNTDDRIKMFEALVQAEPENPHYENLLASAFIQKMRETTDFGYLERASKILESVLGGDGNNYEALRLRSEIELERHNFSKVAEYSRQLTKTAPQDSWNWGTLGDALIELGDYDKAAEAYQRMVSLRPDLSSYNRASYYRFLAGDIEGAISVMKQAISAGSSSAENMAWCLVELGNYYLKSGNPAEAQRAYTAALAAFPDYHPAHAGLGKAQTAKGETKPAIESFKRAQAITPLPDYAAALYDLYSLSGQRSEAAKQMEMIDVMDKLGQANREKANRNLAMIYANHDRKLDHALQLAESELSIRRDIYTYDTLAWCLFKNKKYAEAEKAMEKALKMNTPEPMFYYHAGMIANALGKKAVAEQHLKRAQALNPKLML